MAEGRSGGRRWHSIGCMEVLILGILLLIVGHVFIKQTMLRPHTRGKVSRCQNDMRTLAVALDAYFVDHNTYPRDHTAMGHDADLRWEPWTNEPETEVGLYYLTTPKAYAQVVVSDPFNYDERALDGSHPGKYSRLTYTLASGYDNSLHGARNVHAYLLCGYGPDMESSPFNVQSWPSSGTARASLAWYSPTNGTKSAGDLYRFGGSYRQGNWYAHGIRWDK